MLAISTTFGNALGAPERPLVRGSDFRVTSGGVAVPLSTSARALFLGVQRSINQAGPLFGLPLAIAVDAKIGPATGRALRLLSGRIPGGAKAQMSAQAQSGDPVSIAVDAGNVVAALGAAIEGRSPALVKTAPTPPTVHLKPITAPSVLPRATEFPQRPDVAVPSPPPTAALKPVSTLPEGAGAKRLPTGVFVGIVGAFLLAGTAAAVIVARR